MVWSETGTPRLTRLLKDPWSLICLKLAAALVAVNAYRAATQSYTIDEAYSYNMFIAPRMADAWRFYDPNHHVLLALLCRFCVWLFGTGEFSLRLPVVIGGGLYLVSSVAILRSLTASSPLLLAAYGSLALNPFVLDFLSASRGYGLALGLWTAAVALIQRSAGNNRKLQISGVLLGLSVAANLVFAVPAAAVGLALMLDQRLRKAPIRRIFHLGIPAVLTAVLVLTLPLLHFVRGSLTYGGKSLGLTLFSLFAISFHHHFWAGWNLLERAAPALQGAIAAFAIVAVCACFFAKRLLSAARIVLFTFAAVLLLLIFMHYGAALPYPFGRTGIYLVPLFTFVIVSLVEATGRSFVHVTAVVILLAACCCFLGEWETQFYGEWRFDAGTKRILQIASSRPHAPSMKLGASSLNCETLTYYRATRKLWWLEPVQSENLAQQNDLYILTPENAGLIQERNLRVVYRDAVSDQILAEPDK